jgi:predicted secreted Zn-dependent protease
VAPKVSSTENHTFSGTKVTINQQIEVKRYLVSGCSANDIWGSIVRNMPLEAGNGFAGITDSHQDVAYTATSASNSCTVKSATITLKSTIFVPELANSNGMDQALLAKWNAFVAGIQKHEPGHVDISLNGAKELQRTIEALAPAATCQALQTSMLAAQDRVAASVNAKNLSYDKDTNHGYTQGPMFP